MRAHAKTIEAKLDELQHTPRASRHARYQELYRYHIDRLRDFQHERLIHLLVTLFVGCLTVGAVVTLFTTILAFPDVPTMVPLLVAALATLLLVTELFYLLHYYRLENGTQRLYQLSQTFSELLTK